MGKKIEKIPVDEDFQKHMHDGHRGRLLKTVTDGNFHDLSDVQKLEFILFYIIPRGDVNPLAHNLLAHFGHICNVMDASYEELMRVKGIGETAARKISALLQIFDGYQMDKFNNNYSISEENVFLELIEMLLRFKNEEHCYLFGIAPSGLICHPRHFARGSAGKVNFDGIDVTHYIHTFKVSQIILVHNHPNGDACPSKQDVNSFIKIANMIGFCGVKLYDSFIVGRNGIYSWNRDTFIKTFATKDLQVDDIKKSQQKKIASQG